MNRIDLIQNRDRWPALVNSEMIFRFHKLREISWLAENHLASQEGLYSVKLVSLVSYLLSTFWHFIYKDLFYLYPSSLWRKSPSGPRPPHYRGFMITLRYTTLGTIPLYEWSARRRDKTQHSQETIIHPPGGIRTHKPSKPAATDLRLRPRGHWFLFFNIGK